MEYGQMMEQAKENAKLAFYQNPGYQLERRERKSFIIKLGYIKAIVKSDGIYLFDIDKPKVLDFSNFLIQKLKDNENKETNFELKVLDAMLLHICNSFDSTLEESFPQVVTLLQHVSNNNSNFDSIITIQNKLIDFQTNANDVINVISELLASDEDMSKIYISKENNPIDQHTEVEFLLENYQKHVQEILNEISGMLKEIEFHQRVINLKFASRRNKLASLNVKLGLFSLAISMGSIITGIFGMNLYNKLEESYAAFLTTVFLIFIIVGVFVLYFLRYYKSYLI